MISSREEMIRREKSSGKSVSQLIECAAGVLFDQIRKLCTRDEKILILCGKGNNGADGLLTGRYLLQDGYDVHFYLIDGKPVNNEAAEICNGIDEDLFIRDIEAYVRQADTIIDAVYGFSYHGELSAEVRKIFRLINSLSKKVISIDLNSGSEADSGYYDEDTLISTYTLVLQSYKPVHLLNKSSRLAGQLNVLDMGLPELQSEFYETSQQHFFTVFPKRRYDDYKGSYGKILFLAGSYGMAGAACLNLLGAKTFGFPYIEALVSEKIYPLVASKFITVVFHPFAENDLLNEVKRYIKDKRVLICGSGINNLENKETLPAYLLNECDNKLVLDAEMLNLINSEELRSRKNQRTIVLTPHIGEFARLSKMTAAEIRKRPLKVAREFAEKHNVILALKGVNTIVAGPDGRVYVNNSGNEALAQAGSGDLLSGMIGAMLGLIDDDFAAVCEAVFMHGHLADLGTERYARQTFDLCAYPDIMNELFREYGF